MLAHSTSRFSPYSCTSKKEKDKLTIQKQQRNKVVASLIRINIFSSKTTYIFVVS